MSVSDVTLTEAELETVTDAFWEGQQNSDPEEFLKPAVEAIVAARVAGAWNEAERAVERQTNLAELVYFDKPSDFRKGVLSSLTAVKAARAAALRAEGGS